MKTARSDGGGSVVHLVEVGGRGGVYHHTLGLGRALRDAGIDVLLHTAADAEQLDDGLPRCACMHWVRSAPNGIRQPLTAMRYLARTVPHLVRTTRRSDVVHVQGLFGNQLTAWLIFRLSRRRRRVALSPHNTFARSGRRLDARTIRWMCRRADAVFAFTEADHQRLQSWGVSASKVDLVFFLPEPDARELAVWRERFAQRPVALLAGQVRADKRPDVFVEACEMAGVTPAVVGPAGDGEELVRTPGVGVLRVDGYLPLDSFVAAVATCDVVVATHRVGSVSGPLAFARQLGVRSVAPVVGGLAEEVTLVVDRDDAAGFAAAITDVLGAPDPEPRPATRAAQQHLAGYRQLGPFADVVDPVR